MFPTFKRLPLIFQRLHLAEFVALWICTFGASCVTGELMNVVNGWVSPRYFQFFFYDQLAHVSWTPSELYWHSIQQGLLEGAVSGLVIATIFTGFVFVVSTASCPFAVSKSFLPHMFFVTILFWFLGGLNGAFIGLIFPDSWVSVPVTDNKATWLYVGGSIWGAYFGALVALIRSCISFNRTWQTMKNSTALDNAVPE